jgi:hypothetical protein
MNTFKDGLEVEKQWQATADELYNTIYPDYSIYRPTWKEDREAQAADVDVILTNTKHREDQWLISEKFRSHSWDDLLIELYDDYDKGTKGWGRKSLANEIMFYFGNGMDSYVRSIPAVCIRFLAEHILTDRKEYIAELAKSGKVYNEMTWLGFETPVLFVPTFGTNKKILWRSCCVAISDEIFKYLRMNIKEYKLKDYAIFRKG